MEDSFRFTQASRWAVGLAIAVCITVLGLYPASLPFADAVRGLFTSILAAVASLLLFYYVDPRLKRRTYEDILADSGLRRVATNKEFERAFWTDVISELPTAEEEVFLVGKRLSEWRAAPVYSDPLLNGLKKRVERAKDCKDKKKFVTTIIVEDRAAHTEWTNYLSSLKADTSRIRLLAPGSTIPYALTIVGKRMVVVHYVGNRTTSDTLTLDVLHDSNVWKLYAQDVKQFL